MKKSDYTRRLRNFTINFGPQHPAAHGVLRLVLDLKEEIMKRATPQFGLFYHLRFFFGLPIFPESDGSKIWLDILEILGDPVLVNLRAQLEIIDVYGFTLGMVFLVVYFNWLIVLAYPVKKVRILSILFSLLLLLFANWIKWLTLIPLLEMLITLFSNMFHFIFDFHRLFLFNVSTFWFIIFVYLTYIFFHTAKLLSTNNAKLALLGSYIYFFLFFFLDLSEVINKVLVLFVCAVWLIFMCNIYGGYQNLKFTFHQTVAKPFKNLNSKDQKLFFDSVKKAIFNFHTYNQKASFYQKNIFYLSLLLTVVDFYLKALMFGLILADATNRQGISVWILPFNLLLSGVMYLSFIYLLLLGFNALTFDKRWFEYYGNSWGKQTLAFLGWNSPWKKTWN